MAVIAAAEIPGILTGLGWSPHPMDDRTWRCTVPTPAGDAKIVVRHASTWLYLVVIPFLDESIIKPWGRGRFPPRFLGRILAVNNNLVLVKFALDDEGDLTLRVELPTESLQRREVETAAQLLLQTTAQYRGPIREALLEAHRASMEPPPAALTQDLSESDLPAAPPAPPSEPPPELTVSHAEPTSGESQDPGSAPVAGDTPGTPDSPEAPSPPVPGPADGGLPAPGYGAPPPASTPAG